ncbi:MAG: Ig-like domain-containing protein, partial [Bacteroidales bacterium]|nr:Ig-like domain-containing protein [Bacteroidales bacterium]
GITTWTNRQKVDAARWSNGAPWEIVVALANYTGRDMWINIPVAADDNYITELATLIKNSLRPDVNIYIEYSNEVWNGSFTQYDYNYSAVLNSPEDADIRASTTYDDRRRARRVAKRVIRCGQIFEQVFGITVASRTRIRPVFAWQIGGWLPWYDDVLTWMNTTYGPPKNFIYGIASAPYFNDGLASGSATPQQVVAAMTTASNDNVSSIQTLAGYANQWDLKHLQYEGGPDNGGGSTTNLANRINANRLPEMKTAVIHNYKDNWFSSNANGTAPVGTNDVANYFVMSGGGVSRYGCWGATEDLNYLSILTNAPKYDALCELTGMCGNEPSVTLLTPLNNDVVQVNNLLTITANANDIDGTVKKVEFFVGSTFIGSDTIAPYSIDWTPDTTGITIVLAKAIDNDGKYKLDDPHIVEVVNSTGVSEKNKEQIINISPIPAKNIINIEFEKSPVEHMYISIYDIAGKIIYKKEENKINNKISIDISTFTSGLYFLKIEGSKINSTKKLIIQQ